MVVTGCSEKKANPEEIFEQVFTSNQDTAIMDTWYGKVGARNVEVPEFWEFWGSKRNTEHNEVDDFLNELQSLTFTNDDYLGPSGSEKYYVVRYDGQFREDHSTFEMNFYINPDTHLVYLDEIRVNSLKSPINYNRLYEPTPELESIIKELLETNE